MALQLARPKEITPPQSPDGNPKHSLAGSQEETEPRLDAETLLASALEQWRDEHATLCQRQLEERGVSLQSAPPSLHLELSGHIPDLDKMDTALAMGRRVDVQFIPHRDGDATICVHHPESAEILSFPCCVEVTFREKVIGDAEAGLLRQAFQMSLAARVNTFFNRMVSEVNGDHTTPRPVFC